jgi:hypothetical protein
VRERIKSCVEKRESEECSFTPEISKSQRSYHKNLIKSQLQRGGQRQGRGYGEESLFQSPVAWNEEEEEEDLYDCPVATSAVRGGGAGGRGRGRRREINMLEPEKMAKEIQMKLVEKEERRQQELILKEIQELKECTFQPKINPPPPGAGSGNSQGQRAVVIKGLGRHLELRNLLKRQKEMERKRSEEAFNVRNVDKYRSAADGLTIVQVTVLPFPSLLSLSLPLSPVSFPPSHYLPLYIDITVAVSFAREKYPKEPCGDGIGRGGGDQSDLLSLHQ